MMGNVRGQKGWKHEKKTGGKLEGKRMGNVNKKGKWQNKLHEIRGPFFRVLLRCCSSS